MTLLRLSVLFPFLALSVAAQSSPPQPLPEAPSPPTVAPAGAPVVYVSDFDLDVVPRKPVRRSAAAVRASSGVTRTGPSPASEQIPSPRADIAEVGQASKEEKEETPADHATALVNA